MNFKETTRFYLNEAARRVEDVVLTKGVKVNDVVKGWTKIRNPIMWDKITESEFINYIYIYMEDNGRKGRERKDKPFISNFKHEDFKMAYLKFRSILMDEKALKKGKTINFSDMRSELDRNPGKPENMILNIFFDIAAEEAKKGITSKTHMEALRNNSE